MPTWKTNWVIFILTKLVTLQEVANPRDYQAWLFSLVPLKVRLAWAPTEQSPCLHFLNNHSVISNPISKPVLDPMSHILWPLQWGKKAFLKASHAAASSSDLLSSTLHSPASWGGACPSHGDADNQLNTSEVTPSPFSKTPLCRCPYACVQCMQVHVHKPNPTSVPSLWRIVSGPVVIEMAKIIPWCDSKCDLEEKLLEVLKK